MTNLSEELKAAINKNLPTMVGEELNSVLKDYEKIKAELKDMKAQRNGLADDLNAINALDRDYNDNKRMAEELESRMIAISIKEQILELREKHAQERVNEIRGLTDVVFRSNRFNYDVSLQVPITHTNTQPGGYSNTYSIPTDISGTIGTDKS